MKVVPKNPRKQSLIGIQKLLYTFIDGGTIHICFRVSNCISNHPRSLPAVSCKIPETPQGRSKTVINCPALHI